MVWFLLIKTLTMEYLNSDTLIYMLLMPSILFLLISLHKLDIAIVIFKRFLKFSRFVSFCYPLSFWCFCLYVCLFSAWRNSSKNSVRAGLWFQDPTILFFVWYYVNFTLNERIYNCKLTTVFFLSNIKVLVHFFVYIYIYILGISINFSWNSQEQINQHSLSWGALNKRLEQFFSCMEWGGQKDVKKREAQDWGKQWVLSQSEENGL